MSKTFHTCFSLLLAWLIVPPAAYSQESGELLAASPPAAAASPVEIEPEQSGSELKEKRSLFKYGRSGLQIGEKDKGRFSAKVNIRSQLRFSSPFRSAPRKESQFGGEGERDFRFQRARFKVEGHAFTPWIDYKFEHDLVNNQILDARMTIGKWESLQFQFGQWKVDYSRERIDSSGKQQFADRSIVNRAFTLDRQKGATVLGRLMKGTVGDSRYYVGVFAGNGRGFRTPAGAEELDHSDGSPLVTARYQWNFLGRDVGHSQSDLEYNDKPAAALSFGTARNRSRYTRFSSSGGGQLDGFALGRPGQYALRQFMEEATMKYRGLSLQHELHWKRVEDTATTKMTYMRGGYVQAGYFFHHVLPQIPKQLEVGTRYAMVDPNRTRGNDLQKELAFVANWFFYGHGNKLTFDTSRFSLGQLEGSDLKDTQVRLQWDVSF
ncbi:MAG: porin [Acidobacteria bacterium]|nr:porin [Acidobacteriota bacterium]